ncbi:MAG: ATP-binding protein [Ktedonobacterales bacterium]
MRQLHHFWWRSDLYDPAIWLAYWRLGELAAMTDKRGTTGTSETETTQRDSQQHPQATAGVQVATQQREPNEPLRVLVAEGDVATLATVASILRYDGYEIVTAGSVAEMLQRLDAAPLDAILLDLRLTSVHEADALAQIQALAPATVVIVLATYSALEAALHALRSGAYAYLMKPLDVEELRITLSHALERRRLERELIERRRELDETRSNAEGFDLRVREQVDEATTALRRQVESLDDANHRLQQAQEQHDRFVAMVAHEMRGPLNPIINYAQLAKRPTATAEMRARYMDIIVEHAFRLNRLVDDLQTATRLSTGQFTLRRERCDVAVVVSELVDQFTASSRDRVFTLERPEEPIFAEVDRDRVTQAVRNLIDNSMKYSVSDGAIEARIWQDDTQVHISIGDYGAGIPESEMKRIFEAFTRLQDHSADVSGSGLGLYITRGIVAAHGGALDVRNRTGEGRASGAVFTISLPLAVPASPVVVGPFEMPTAG